MEAGDFKVQGSERTKSVAKWRGRSRVTDRKILYTSEVTVCAEEMGRS